MADKNNLTTLAKRLRPLLGTYIQNLGGLLIGEGPGIDVVKTGNLNTVGLGGDTILLYHADGSPVSEFAATDAGLTAGLAAMTTDDVLEIPDIYIVGGPWRLDIGTLKGHSMIGSALEGELTISMSGVAEHLIIIRNENSESSIYGVKLEGGAEIYNLIISVLNETGDAIGVYTAIGTSGTVYVDESNIYATSLGGQGYAFVADGAGIIATTGYVKASTAPVRAGDNVTTFGIAISGYAMADRGIPMEGDRGAWDALYYPEVHTNDVDIGGIHWTSDGIIDLMIDNFPDHDHSGDAGDGGQFDLVNLLSTGAGAGQVPTADGAGGIAWADP